MRLPAIRCIPSPLIEEIVALLTQLGDENDELHREMGKNKKKKEKES
jgi:hypothetical protein